MQSTEYARNPKQEDNMGFKNHALLNYLQKFPKNSYILSADGYNDENIVELAKRRFMHLHGISLNKKIYEMPFYTWAKYSYNDMYNTHYPNGFFDVVYNLNPRISRAEDFLLEAQRILDSGGVLVLNRSIDKYAKAALEFFTRIPHSGFSILKRKPRPKKMPRRINVVICTLDKPEGINFTTRIMKKRLAENGIKVQFYKTYGEAPRRYPTIIEWSPGIKQPIPEDTNNIIETHEIPEPKNSIGFSFGRLLNDKGYKYWLAAYLLGLIKLEDKNKKVNDKLQQHVLLARSYELAEYGGLKKYFLMPHVMPKEPERILNETRLSAKEELHLGAYGFAAWYKNFDKICDIALRLGIKATLMLSINRNNRASVLETSGSANWLRKRYDGANDGKIKVMVGEWSNAQLEKELKKCTHLISTQVSVRNVSSSMRFMASIGRPVISVDNYQAREAQAIRVKSLDDINIDFLERTRTELINMDDGLRYICKVLESTGQNK